jgi:hypothetical protein
LLASYGWCVMCQPRHNYLNTRAVNTLSHAVNAKPD